MMWNKKKKRSIGNTAIIGSLLVVLAGLLYWADYQSKEGMRFTACLGNGINIGNSLDATGVLKHRAGASTEYYETYWHNPLLTEELFAFIREGGFQSVRIPVTWDEHMDAEGNIETEWMDRVQEVVDMALDENLYVILDTHHETWLNLETDAEEEICTKLSWVWTQIAQRFASYDTSLLFEGMNEPRLRDTEYEWNAGTKELREMVNRLNRVFVDAVRAAGGENEERYLLICPYANRYETEALEDFEYIEGHIIVSVHAYIPYSFCDGDAENRSFDADNKKDTEKVDTLFDWLEEHYVKNNIPVIITEFGSEDKDNKQERLEWLQYYLTRAGKAGIPCFWWDDGRERRLVDRNDLEWKEKEIVEILLQ